MASVDLRTIDQSQISTALPPGAIDLSTIPPDQISLKPIDLSTVDPATVSTTAPVAADGPGLATPFKALARGAGEGMGQLIAGSGTLGAGFSQGLMAQFDAVDAGKEPDYSGLSTVGKAALFEYYHSPAALRTAQRNLTAGLGGIFAGEQKHGAQISADTAAAIPLTPAEQASQWAKVPQMVGTGAPAVAGMVLAGPAGTPAVLGIGAEMMGSQGAEQGFQDALAHGADLDTAYKAAFGSAAIQGGLGALPVAGALERINIATGGMFTRVLMNAVKTGGSQAAIGAVQQTLTNLQAKGLYDPDRGITEGVGDMALTAGLAGAITGGALGMLPKESVGAGTPPTEKPTPAATATAGPRPGETPVTATAHPGTAEPTAAAPAIGEPLGLRRITGAPERVVLEGIQDGHAFVRDEAGNVRGVALDDFQRDLTTPPPASERPGNPTTVPPVTHLDEAPPLSIQDEFFSRPGVEPEVTPRQRAEAPIRPEQGALPLPDMRQVDVLVRKASMLRAQAMRAEEAVKRGSPVSSPGEILVMREAATHLENQAEQIRGSLAQVVERPTRAVGNIPDTQARAIEAEVDAVAERARAAKAAPLPPVAIPDGPIRLDTVPPEHITTEPSAAVRSIKIPDHATTEAPNERMDNRPAVLDGGPEAGAEIPTRPAAVPGVAERVASGAVDQGRAGESGDAAVAGSTGTADTVAQDLTPATTFQTAKGSTYTVHDDGTTTRVKAARDTPGHEGDSGQKPRTEKTVYIDKGKAILSAAGLSGIGPKGARLAIKDGKATLLMWNDKAGKWGTTADQRDIPIFDQPAVGREPLELWGKKDDVPGYEAYSHQHAGNEITKMGSDDSEPTATGGGNNRIPPPDLPTAANDEFKDPTGKPMSAPEVAAEGLRRNNAATNKMTYGVSGPERVAMRLGQLWSLPVALASRDHLFANVFGSVLDRWHRLNELEHSGAPDTAPYFGLDTAAKNRVNQLFEVGRLYGMPIPDDGRNIIIKVPDNRTPYGNPRPELSKPGQVIALNAAESAAARGLDKFGKDRLDQYGSALAKSRGYDGPFTEAAIKETYAAAAPNSSAQRTAARAMQVYAMIDEMRRTPYVPFDRFGHYYIKVTPKDPIGGEEGGMWTVDKPSIFDTHQAKADGSNDTANVRMKRAELEKEYPPAKYHYETGELGTRNGLDVIMNANIPMLEKLFAVLDRPGFEQSAKALDDIMDKMFEIRKAGFKKKSANVRGYSVDFERAWVKYNRTSAAAISNLEHRRSVDEAVTAMQDHPNADVRKYSENYLKDIETPDSPLSQGLRAAGFFQTIWGSPASAATNMLQTATVSLPEMHAIAGPRAVPALGAAWTDAMDAVTVGRSGLKIDWSKVGRTDAERAAVARWRAQGRLDPRLSEESQGRQVVKNPNLRPFAKRLTQFWDAGASMFSVVEQVNRIAAALATHRLLQSPGVRARMLEVHKDNQNFQRMVRREGLTPENAGGFMTDISQFIGGKVNRAPIMRGPGTILTQFTGYTLNALHRLRTQAAKMGWHGKAAFALSIGALGSQSGLLGLPYAQNAADLIDSVYKSMTGHDPQIATTVKRFAADSVMPTLGAMVTAMGLKDAGDAMVTPGAKALAGEIATHGAGRLAGVDLASRTGMGEIVPSGDPLQMVPLASSTIGQYLKFQNKMADGQSWSAWAELVPGAGPRNLAKAAALAKEGYSTGSNNIVEYPLGSKAPNAVTTGQVLARGLGFQPSAISSEIESRYAQERAATATQAASTKLLKNISRELAMGQDALRAGDKATSDAHYAAMRKLIADNATDVQEAVQSGHLEDMVPTPQAGAIRAALKQQLDFNAAMLQRTSKTKRPVVQEIQQLTP